VTGRRADASYAGSRVTTKLKIADLEVAVMAEKDAADDADVVTYAELSRGTYKRLIVRDNRLTGAILIGAGSAVPAVAQAFMDDVPLPEQRSDLLFPQFTDPAPASVELMPDHARICDCNAVNKAQLVEAVLAGATSLRSVCERTRAGTGCGSCRPEVQRVIDFVRCDLDRPGSLASPALVMEGLLHAS
jgi:nitrite reductase (NADH) large subunit